MPSRLRLIGAGTLRPDGLDWIAAPERLDLAIENRNVHFLRHLGNGVVFAGIEGALLKSTDYGATWRFVIHHPLSGGTSYPYAYHFVATEQVLLLGGFDKANQRGYLAWSNDGGETWTDASQLVGDATVELLAQDADGRLLAGLLDGERFTLAEVILGERGFRKRRAARP